ncbi:hypothetical protein ILUMI_12204, partial [Ignelater luminosus]
SRPISRKRPGDKSKENQRKQSITYTFEVNGDLGKVCKIFFLNTLGISETVVKNALEKRNFAGFTAPGMREKHTPKNKLPETVKDSIAMHIRSFLEYNSHYSRNKTNKLYLSSDLNIDKMSSGARLLSMEVNDIKKFTGLYSDSSAAFTNRKQNVDKETFHIFATVWLEVRRDDPDFILQK